MSCHSYRQILRSPWDTVYRKFYIVYLSLLRKLHSECLYAHINERQVAERRKSTVHNASAIPQRPLCLDVPLLQRQEAVCAARTACNSMANQHAITCRRCFVNRQANYADIPNEVEIIKCKMRFYFMEHYSSASPNGPRKITGGNPQLCSLPKFYPTSPEYETTI
jgi:hypothetical protein